MGSVSLVRLSSGAVPRRGCHFPPCLDGQPGSTVIGIFSSRILAVLNHIDPELGFAWDVLLDILRHHVYQFQLGEPIHEA